MMWLNLKPHRSLSRTWSQNTLYRAARVLSRRDRQKMYLVILIQVFLSVLDLIGVVLIGVLGALAVTGVGSHQPGTRVETVLKFLQISGKAFEVQAAILGATAVLFLVGRTILSIIFTRRILFFLSNRGANISANLISRLLSQPMLTLQSRSTQETLFSVTIGVEVITLRVLAMTVTLVSDLALVIVMLVGLFVVDPIIALGTFGVFGVVGVFLYLYMHVRAHSLGLRDSQLRIQSNQKITEVFSSYRESVVRNRRDYYGREIGKMRFSLAGVMAESSFLPFVSKYVIETVVVLGAVLLGAAQFVLKDATHAVGTLSVFLAAGTRIAPAILRLQQGIVSIRGNLAAATGTLDLIDGLQAVTRTENFVDTVDVTHEGFQATIEIRGVTITYPNKSEAALSDITLSIPVGSSVAIVGPSGAGKTTLVDVLLGVIDPDLGNVLISGLSPMDAITKWPGAISYVAQDVVISDGTVRENIGLGYPIENVPDELVLSALKVAHLDSFIKELPQGLETQVGERGTQISGGQRQRLGIARAMFTRPHLLVLDEATSSLDAETEESISDAIYALRGVITVVMIAHRLSTVRQADIVIYIDKGRIVSIGSFNEVRENVPDFDHQAKLMGL